MCSTHCCLFLARWVVLDLCINQYSVLLNLRFRAAQTYGCKHKYLGENFTAHLLRKKKINRFLPRAQHFPRHGFNPNYNPIMVLMPVINPIPWRRPSIQSREQLVISINSLTTIALIGTPCLDGPYSKNAGPCAGWNNSDPSPLTACKASSSTMNPRTGRACPGQFKIDAAPPYKRSVVSSAIKTCHSVIMGTKNCHNSLQCFCCLQRHSEWEVIGQKSVPA